jgi:subtilase family serine protease
METARFHARLHTKAAATVPGSRCTAIRYGRETIGIVTLAALDVGAPEYVWQKVANVPATGRTVSVDNVDGGPGAPSDATGTGETDLDVEQSGALAPGAW